MSEAVKKPDVIIVGAGTAGLTAAIYCQRAGKQALVFDGAGYGGQIINTPEIENYPGIAKISGYEFATALYEQAKALGAEIRTEKVLSVEDMGSMKKVATDEGDYSCGAVILATGAKNRPLGLEREKELMGAGISYCATCDGAFFRNKPVAVAGGGNTALEDAAFLANYCSKVYLIHRRDQFRADSSAQAALKNFDNIEYVLNANVTELIGSPMLEKVVVTDKNSGEKRELEVSCLFVAIGQRPENSDFANVAKLDEGGYIVADESCRTGTDGVFTAGDCRTKAVRQLTTAAADGAASALAACAYLNQVFTNRS
jgi:thioredoxin reductase (NADPH)